ncbi:restriction endonuclease subunit S [Pseudomonas sp. CAU 1711]|uniref:restriction endonuclease subunit S n=1 Tax=Pseudomonas sp. CAU 1711 TaxID=3140356 RepID=UPI0032616EE6
MASDTQLTPYGEFSVSLIGSRLADLCLADGVQTGPFGSQLHQEDYVEDGTPIITVEHLGENRILHQNLPRVSEEDRLRLAKYSLRTGDIVFSRVGSVDRRAIVREAENGWLFSGRCLRVRPDPEKLDPLWLSYFFGLPTFKQYIRGIAVGATMPSINTKILSDVSIYFPGLSQQRYIATLLASLDDRIELNRRINQTLEAMAQALFKSWFVDFDPVKAKIAARLEGRDPLRAAMSTISGKADAELDALPPEQYEQLAATAVLFPDEMEKSELGEIPRGWGFKSVADIAQFTSGKVDVSLLSEDLYVSTENMLENRAGVTRATSLPSVASVPSFKTGHILISNIRPYFKKIWMARFDGGRSPDVLAFEPTDPQRAEFLYNLLYQDAFFEFMTRTAKGAKMPRGDKDAIMGWRFPCPNEPLMVVFSEKVRPHYAHIEGLVSQSKSLTELRDTLLPKLLSGELSVETLAEQAGIA